MGELLLSFSGSRMERVAVLGYPNPKAVVRLLAGMPQTAAAALISPVGGFAARAEALAARIGLDTAVLALERDPCDPVLRTDSFDVVIARVPVDATAYGRVKATVNAHMAEMLRIGSPHALLILHLTVRIGALPQTRAAAVLGRQVCEIMRRSGITSACLATSVSDPIRGTVDSIGWAHRSATR
jgi:hypothetical protein